MTISDVCYLVTVDKTPHGVHEKREPTERMVYCQVKSIGRTEFYQANLVGMRPEWTLKLSDEAEYQNELTLNFRGERWQIIRTYITEDGGIELVIQRSDVNA